jgi:hypothetical protein
MRLYIVLAYTLGPSALGVHGIPVGEQALSTIASKLTLLQLIKAPLVVVVLYSLMRRQLSQHMTENFMTHGDVVATSVRWAFVTAQDGTVLADTFVPAVPAALNQMTQNPWNRDRIKLPPESEVVVFNQPVLTGIVGNVYLAFDHAGLLASIHNMEWIILLTVGSVSPRRVCQG